MMYFKILLGFCIISLGIYTLFNKLEKNNIKETPISSPKIIFSGVLMIILGIILVFEAIDFF